MNKDFTQAYVSPALIDFKKGFLSQWDLVEYYDQNKPAVFFGFYGQQDINTLLAHKGPKIMVWGGNDMHPPQLNLTKQLVDEGKTFTFAPPGEFTKTLTQYNITHKVVYIPNRDYTKLMTTPLGENIYLYMGRPDNFRAEYFKYNEITVPLQKVFGEDRIKWVTESATLPFDQLVEKYYNDCFCFVKPNDRGGATTMYEFGFMGRMTIGKGAVELPCFREYSNLDNLLEIIMEESKYIGKVREDIADKMNDVFMKDEWLDLNFWK